MPNNVCQNMLFWLQAGTEQEAFSPPELKKKNTKNKKQKTQNSFSSPRAISKHKGLRSAPRLLQQVTVTPLLRSPSLFTRPWWPVPEPVAAPGRALPGPSSCSTRNGAPAPRCAALGLRTRLPDNCKHQPLSKHGNSK